MVILQAIAGLVILLVGRKLYWFTIGAVGFFATLEIASGLLEKLPSGWTIVIAVFIGLLGAALVINLQRLAVGVVGFLLGGFLFYQFLNYVDLRLTGWGWLALIAAGLLGMVITSRLFEWSLIGLTTVIGASLISQSEWIPPQSRLWSFLLALILGLAWQVRTVLREKHQDP